MKTRISVIVPFYNMQEFLNECIDSVLAQTINHMELTDGYERNLQIILVDDGSTDESAKIAREYESNHDNIQYVYEENQGLGHARNYGCEFAQGDYIIFLDSDDKVTPKAYERMYNASVKNDSDMTIGGILRFNSKRYWYNKIIKNTFSSTKDVTHITESLNLIYDTTAWNKLIKHSFWKKHGFKFPEGVLYEDIPVTVVMHYLANNVSIIYEPCYLWRVREGLSKSITQTRTSLKNLNDRLLAMKSIDEYFKANVTQNDLIDAKNIKWLKLDLMLFINKLTSVKRDEANELIDILCNYINTNIDKRYFEYLNEIDKLKYEFLLDKDFDNLIKLITFQVEDLKSQKLDSTLIIEDVCGRSFPITNYIKESLRINYIQKIRLKKDKLIVKGFTIIPGFEDVNFDDRNYSIYLVNSESHKKIPLDFKDVNVKNLDKFNIPFNDSFSYSASGYEVYVPYDKVMNDNDFVGDNRIQITFKQNDIVYNYFAGFAKKNVKSKSRNSAKLINDNYFSIDFDLYNRLILRISHVKPCEDISIKNNRLSIKSEDYNNEMFLYYEEDSINPERKIPLEYGDNAYSISVNELSGFDGKIIYSDNEPVILLNKQLLLLESDNEVISINSLKDYNINIHKSDNATLIKAISQNGDEIRINAHIIKNHNDLKSATLYFKDKKTYEIISVAKNTIDGNNEVNFKFSLADENLTRKLYQSNHDLHISYQDGNGNEFSTLVYSLEHFNFSYQEEDYNYKVHRSKNGTMRLAASKNNKKEDFESKYNQFKHLPINNKRIFFESMWGGKYSCNPRYLYEYIDKNHPDYECIWSLKDEHTPIKGNAIKVRRKSLKYYYYLATSKYFVDNVNLNQEFEKREGQIYLQTMHGTPLKTLGLDVASDFKTEKNKSDYIERCNRWDYLAIQSDYVGDISKRCFLFDRTHLKFGYPRTDLLYSKNNPKDINKIKEKLGLPLDKKVILYAPTWREKNKFDLKIDLKSFKKSLSDEYVMILRLHHFSLAGWKQPKEDDFIYDFSRYDSIEELYLISDILITDYSSVMFDYSILNRPILLFAYDLEEYRDKLRGFYIDIMENNPGPILHSSQEVERAIINIDEVENKTRDLRDKFREKFIMYECENSSERIFEKITENAKGGLKFMNGLADRLFLK